MNVYKVRTDKTTVHVNAVSVKHAYELVENSIIGDSHQVVLEILFLCKLLDTE